MAETEGGQVKQRLRTIMTERALESARPWEPITDEHLSSKELLRLLGVDPKTEHYEYQEFLRVCKIAVQPGENDHLLPDDLRNCFVNRTVKIFALKGRHTGSKGVKIEYRVAIADLEQDYQSKALKIVSGRGDSSLKLNDRTKLFVQNLAFQNNKSVWEIIEELVRREMVEPRLGR